MTQAHRFSNGGYVAHGLYIRPYSTMRFSAWFTDDGKLIDAEGYDRFRRSRPASARAKAELEKKFWHVATIAGGN